LAEKSRLSKPIRVAKVTQIDADETKALFRVQAADGILSLGLEERGP
jgi:hypothetical protein